MRNMRVLINVSSVYNNTMWSSPGIKRGPLDLLYFLYIDPPIAFVFVYGEDEQMIEL